ncbi:flagellar protein FlgN [Georgenia thermotolerans]|uniref:Flagellar protein FlgN n=1 Tax=Georgenia thermotolerans TaxID=527326 RepID=A0A7J5UQ49_9MICO|nr:flagellar protein FlgN [Georgenia thermotolerans]KAE8764073.1 flagellar protein FlgN [Georgenia thermotolerans]
MPLKALSDILWRERELLEQLLFKLEVEQLFLITGRTTRLPLASREVEEVLETIRAAELGRTVEVDEAALALGLPTGVSLLDLAQAAPAPWDAILLEHRKNFVRLTAEINELAQSNRDLLATSHRATQETLMNLRESVHTYDPSGAAAASTSGAQLLDETF